MTRGNAEDLSWWSAFAGANPDVLALSVQLWGDDENLRRQLLAPSPTIPDGLNVLSHLKALERITESIVNERRRIGQRDDPAVPVCGIILTQHEARLEVVRRAIMALRA